ncbi:putative ubiquinone biosynthesis monooxygenase [Apophysomyces sp. BC1034]|nr:putative ubiquinone biosynthesis monooxygenase [Apophysomyces sp. BC1015]KAG0182351.1 putative ubiquinone biosynthesis monooxygenase [Apophysomyces sp. BC1021]KAG0194529.1 putative ubiquinone biosynthesis monooxygenase [Apophysomyces sp. BC1034]
MLNPIWKSITLQHARSHARNALSGRTQSVVRSSLIGLKARHFSTVVNELENAYDVVIIGGGVAGTALACSLASNPALREQRVALVEAMDLTSTVQWAPQENKYSNRVVSLTPGSMNFLEKIGATNYMHADRTNAYSKMQVWDGVSDAKIHFDTDLLGKTARDSNAIAYMVENVHLQNALLKQIDAYRADGAKVDILQKARVASIQLDKQQGEFDLSEWPTVQLENGTVLKARLLVGADGVNSPVRNFSNIESLGWDYDTHGVVATLKLDPSQSNNTAWQRFLPTGPVAMLPLGDGYASMVWSTHPSIARLIKGLPPKDFCHLVNAAYRLSHVDLKYLYSQIDKSTFESACDIEAEYRWRESVATKSLMETEIMDREMNLPPEVVGVEENSRASFPLRMRNSEQYVADRVALVGDAAHATHPLAGQGLNQGLLDVESLSNTLEKGTLEGQDIGNIHLLRTYAAERYVKNVVMLSACDKMHRLFGTDAAPVTWIRSLGLSAVNNMDFLKAEIMRYAMGIEGQIKR